MLLARALAKQPRVLVLDEPTNQLDTRHQLGLVALVRGLGVTTLITLHDLILATAYCDRPVVLQHGGGVAVGTPIEVLTPEVLLEVFGICAEGITNSPPGASASSTQTEPKGHHDPARPHLPAPRRQHEPVEGQYI